jgi:hypothetical protein
MDVIARRASRRAIMERVVLVIVLFGVVDVLAGNGIDEGIGDQMRQARDLDRRDERQHPEHEDERADDRPRGAAPCTRS